MLTVDKIRDLLSDRFRLLTRGTRTAHAHQSTLRTLIDWSFDRLDPLEQAVLRRVSVFRGAWSLEAVEAVAAGGELEPWDTLDVFTRLVEKSLVVREVAAQNTGSAHYRLYETVRAYAQEKLAQHNGGGNATATRLRDYIVTLTAEGDAGLRGRDQAQWAARWPMRSTTSGGSERGRRGRQGADTAIRVAGNYWLAWITAACGRSAPTRSRAHSPTPAPTPRARRT